MTTRRNILTILGFAGVASPAITADDVNTGKSYGNFGPNRDLGLRLNKYDAEKFAKALENLAVEVREKTVNIARFHIGTNAVGGSDYWLTQTLTIDLEILHPDEPEKVT